MSNNATIPNLPLALSVSLGAQIEIVQFGVSWRCTVAQLPGGSGNNPVTPGAGMASVITTGGTAVVLVSGPNSGGYIINPLNAAAQFNGSPPSSGAENAYVDPVASPGSTDATGNGTTAILTPGQRYDFPALAAGVNIYGNAASNGHQLTVVVNS